MSDVGTPTIGRIVFDGSSMHYQQMDRQVLGISVARLTRAIHQHRGPSHWKRVHIGKRDTCSAMAEAILREYVANR